MLQANETSMRCKVSSFIAHPCRPVCDFQMSLKKKKKKTNHDHRHRHEERRHDHLGEDHRDHEE
jgi:hypothetical protein